MGRDVAEPRIIDIELDERTIIRRSDDIERERRVAIFDLLEENVFQPLGHDGPFRIRLRIEASASPASSARYATILRSAKAISKPRAPILRRAWRRSTWPGAACTTRRPSSSKSV
jgi:hypothetical protein